MYIQGIIAGIFFICQLCTWQMKFDSNGKKYNDQPALNGLVGLFNLNINREIKAFNSHAITPIDLRIVKRRNRSLPIRIQKISPPLQHQLALIQMFRFMDIRCPH